MRKVTERTGLAFLNSQTLTVGNTTSDCEALFLHGNLIASKDDDGSIHGTMAGWPTQTTCERLNGLLNLMGKRSRVGIKNFEPVLRDVSPETGRTSEQPISSTKMINFSNLG